MDTRITFENNIAIIKAQNIIFAAILVFCINLHIFQRKVRIVLDHTLNGFTRTNSVFLRNTDGTISKCDRRIPKELEAVGFGTC